MTAYRGEIVIAAGRYDLDPDLVQAIVEQESGYDPAAWNPEPRYRWLWDVRANTKFRALTLAEIAAKSPPADFHALAGDADQEWVAQQASWGLMQIIGANAREHGFRGSYLPELTRDVALNLDVGCRIFAEHVAWVARFPYAGLESARAAWARRKALAAYNAGRAGTSSDAAQGYAVGVLARWDRIRKGQP